MTPNLESKLRGMVWASFCGDALALGIHWIYDPAVIKNDYGHVTEFVNPKTNSFHATKETGAFTHYGDQMMVLLESVAAVNGFDLDDFAHRWRSLFQNYTGYMDKATKKTLANFEDDPNPTQSGSDSLELAGAVRIAPLIYGLHHQPERLKAAVQAQTRMTHNHVETVAAGLFCAQTVSGVLEGRLPAEVMVEVMRDDDAGINQLVQKGLASREAESISAIGGFGRNCSLRSVIPGIVHLVVKYENNLEEALIQSVMAGGDSAARAIAVGMILGAHLGEDAIPSTWVSGLRKRADILRLIDLISGKTLNVRK